MRSIRSLTVALAAGVLCLVPAVAFGQTTPNPTESPVPTGGWTIWQAYGALVLTALLLGGLVAGYMRFAPTFFGRSERPDQHRRELPPGARTAAALEQQQRTGAREADRTT